MKRRRLVLAVAVPFTIVAALLFCALVAGIVASVYYRPTVETTYGVETGRVIVEAVIPVLLTLLFVAAAIFLNISLAADARRRGPVAVWLRRAHLVLTVFTLFWPVCVFFGLMLLDGVHVANALLVIAANAAVVSAVHAAAGVWAIRSAVATSSAQVPLD